MYTLRNKSLNECGYFLSIRFQWKPHVEMTFHMSSWCEIATLFPECVQWTILYQNLYLPLRWTWFHKVYLVVSSEFYDSVAVRHDYWQKHMAFTHTKSARTIGGDVSKGWIAYRQDRYIIPSVWWIFFQCHGNVRVSCKSWGIVMVETNQIWHNPSKYNLRQEIWLPHKREKITALHTTIWLKNQCIL